MYNTYNFGRVRAVPPLCGICPGICLTTEEETRKNLSQDSPKDYTYSLQYSPTKLYSLLAIFAHQIVLITCSIRPADFTHFLQYSPTRLYSLLAIFAYQTALIPCNIRPPDCTDYLQYSPTRLYSPRRSCLESSLHNGVHIAD
jgi:hypothetical protein